ncbi:MAG: exo-beta-N-acetylmuramidase NamZ domain-containing protein [Bacteroidales bacterium]
MSTFRSKVFLLILIFVGFAIRTEAQTITPGAYQTDIYLAETVNKNVALVVNQTSIINQTHLLDTLLKLNVNVTKLFSPEHGIRGRAADGELVDNSIDEQTKIPIVSLYGKNRKPSKKDLQDIDLVIFDLQDVGTRFYTYISTLSYVMEACAENNIEVIVLDRPNPNGYFIDGPVLDSNFSSFVGLHQVPAVYGLTIGEYALMVNGEGWLGNKLKCDLTVIPCLNYTHDSIYKLPIKPSPNLPTEEAVLLYSSLCFFEGTIVSVGRGTDKPFEVIGHPNYSDASFKFTPKPIEGVTVNPPHKNTECNGILLSGYVDEIKASKKINLSLLINMYNDLNIGEKFFNNYFDKLAGTDVLRKQIIDGKTEDEIRETWKSDIEKYKVVRKKYLIYD